MEKARSSIVFIPARQMRQFRVRHSWLHCFGMLANDHHKGNLTSWGSIWYETISPTVGSDKDLGSEGLSTMQSGFLRDADSMHKD